MNHSARFMVVAGAAFAFASAHIAIAAAVPAPAPVAPAVDHGGAQSVRPTTAEVRTSVGGLMGWQVGVFANVFPSLTFTEAAVLTDALGLASIGGDSNQKVSPELDKPLNYQLSANEVAMVKAKLKSLRLKMEAYQVDGIPADDAAARKLFAFAKDLGATVIVTKAVPASLAAVDKLASENGVDVAIESQGDLKGLMSSVNGLSPHIGLSIDFAKEMQQGSTPLNALAQIKTRLRVAKLRDRNALGPKGHDVRLGMGEADLQKFLMEVAKQEPPPQEDPDKCVNCGRPYGGTAPLFIALEVDPWQVKITTEPQPGTSGGTFADLWQAANDFEKAARPAMGYRVEQDALLIPPTKTDRIPADVKAQIVAALPKPLVAPKQPRKLLIVDVAPAGAYYHDTAAHANFAIQKMADTTGAFQAIFNNDLNNLKYPKILDYDAVFLNSGDGEVFSDPQVLDGLSRFVREGGGVAGLHGASYASMDIPEFGELIGAQSGPHKVEKATLKVDDPNSPIMQHFASSPLTADLGGKGFIYTDEFYHFLPTGPYSRNKLHVLLSIDADKSDLTPWHVREDKDYGMVWIKSYGEGRVFNCAMGHTPTLFTTPALSQMMLNAIQFVLGDLPADTTPSAMLGGK